MEVERGFVEVDGGRLYFEAVGAGEAVLMVHGFALDVRMWDGQVEPLSAAHRVIRYDIRGYGQSSVPGSGVPYSHIEDLRAVLRHVGEERAHIVALSLGGAIALEFTLRYPGMVRSLTLVDSVLWGSESSPEEGAWYAAIWRAGGEQGIEAAKELWLRHPLFTASLENAEVGRQLHEMVDDYSGWHWVYDDKGYYPETPAAHRLGEIAVPTLVVVGERDTPDMLGVAERLANEIPGARKVVMAKVGHMANMEDPARFNEIVRIFLNEVSAREMHAD